MQALSCPMPHTGNLTGWSLTRRRCCAMLSTPGSCQYFYHGLWVGIFDPGARSCQVGPGKCECDYSCCAGPWGRSGNGGSRFAALIMGRYCGQAPCPVAVPCRRALNLEQGMRSGMRSQDWGQALYALSWCNLLLCHWVRLSVLMPAGAMLAVGAMREGDFSGKAGCQRG